MNPSDAAMLLGTAAAFDNRKVGEADATAWAAALEDANPQDCQQAIVQHYRTSKEWIGPSDVLRIVKNIRWSRIEAVGHVDPPRELGDYPERENAWRREFQRALGDGFTREAAEQRAHHALGIRPEPLALDMPLGDVLRQVRESMRLPKPTDEHNDTTGATTEETS